MIGKLLIDECLSPELVQMAVDAGHGESTCVRNRGWVGKKGLGTDDTGRRR